MLPDSILDILPDAMEVDAQVLENERTEALLDSILELPEPNREIMVRRYFHFQPVQTIADALGMPKSAVKNRI